MARAARLRSRSRAAPRARPPSPTRLRHAKAVLRALERQVPEPRCELDHASPWQLLVATILSAQSTDRTVNRVTPGLFAAYPMPHALAEAPQEEVERHVRATGFFRNKARAIREASRHLVECFDGDVPRDMDSLLSLPGVARKTANVVLGTAYGVAEGIVTDVHAIRVSQRLGLTKEREPAKIEAELMRLCPRREWIDLGHRLVLLGRYTCLARKPKCDACACAPVCPSAAPSSARAAPASVGTPRRRSGRDRRPRRARAIP